MMTCSYLRAEGPGAPGRYGAVRFGTVDDPTALSTSCCATGRPPLRPTSRQDLHSGRACHAGLLEPPEETEKVLRDGWLWSGDLPAGMRTASSTSSAPKESYLRRIQLYPPGLGMPVELPWRAGGSGYQTDEISVRSRSPSSRPNPAPARNLRELRSADGIRTPRRWHFVEHLPRTGNAKVDKALRASLATDVVA